MNASSSTPEATERPLNRLGFVETSVHSIVDGSCKALDAGLGAAVHYSGDTCRPSVEAIRQQTSDYARKTALAAKQGTADVLKKLDPTVLLTVASRMTTLQKHLKYQYGVFGSVLACR